MGDYGRNTSTHFLIIAHVQSTLTCRLFQQTKIQETKIKKKRNKCQKWIRESNFVHYFGSLKNLKNVVSSINGRLWARYFNSFSNHSSCKVHAHLQVIPSDENTRKKNKKREEINIKRDWATRNSRHFRERNLLAITGLAVVRRYTESKPACAMGENSTGKRRNVLARAPRSGLWTRREIRSRGVQ